MSKIFRVARTEYLNVVRTKAFLVSVLLMPVFMGGAAALQTALKDRVDLKDRTFAVVDATGRLFAPLQQQAARRNLAVFETKEGVRRQTKPRFVPEASDADPRALSDRVRAGKLFAYVLIGAKAIEDGAEIAYHTDTPTYDDLPNWIRWAVNEEIRRIRFQEAGIDPQTVTRLSSPANVGVYGLVAVSETGEVREAERVSPGRTFGVPMAAMFLLFMLVMMAAPQQLNHVIEEKMQRISEILVSSVSPFELFLGKLVGTVFVSWTLSVLYLGGVIVLAYRFGFADAIPIPLVAWFLFFQLLALFLYGSICSGLGAACSEIRDAQSMMLPVMLIVMIPMFVWMPVLRNPDSTFAVTMSLIPPATPFLLLMRMAVPPGPATWEIVVGTGLTVAFTLLCVWAAGRIFRVGILSQGQTPSFRRLLSWIRTG